MLAKYSAITELTPELLNTLIDHIYVYTPESVDGVMEQTFDIYYRYGGAIENVEFVAGRFYKSDKVMQATRQRAERQKKERIAAVAKITEETPLQDDRQSA